MKSQKSIKYGILLALVLIINLSIISAAESTLSVNSFSCTPVEVAINNIFSCTAQVKNTGGSSQTLNTATLYPDSNDWLENSNYPQAYGSSISSGQTGEVTFTGLRAVKSGNNGFARITLDLKEDTYVADNNKKVNVIDVAVTTSNTVSSGAIGTSLTSTSEVTSGGNIDVTLTWTKSSGGCAITSQDSQKTIAGMQDGNKQSRSWTVTLDSSSCGNCVFTITAAATGANGIASKTDSTSNTITCTNCAACSSGTPTSPSPGGGGGGGGGKIKLGALTSERTTEMGGGMIVEFSIANGNHSITVENLAETTAKIKVESTPQEFTLKVGDKVNVDLNGDNNADISIKLKSINIITKLATFIITPLTSTISPTPLTTSISESNEESPEAGTEASDKGSGISQTIKSISSNAFFISIVVVIIVLVVILIKHIRQFGMFRSNYFSNLKHHHIK
jgi:hypothetical protein